MPVPTTKAALQHAIVTEYTKLKKELASIPQELATAQTFDGHAKDTQMSLCDLLAYLIGWGELVLKWVDHKDRHLPVDFPETGYKWNELGKLAQKFYRDYETLDYLQLQEKLDQTVDALLVLIESKSNAELYEVPWYTKWTLGRMIQFNTSSPYANARGRIRKWKKEQSNNPR